MEVTRDVDDRLEEILRALIGDYEAMDRRAVPRAKAAVYALLGAGGKGARTAEKHPFNETADLLRDMRRALRLVEPGWPATDHQKQLRDRLAAEEAELRRLAAADRGE